MSQPEDEITEKNKVLDSKDKSKLPIYDLEVQNIRPNPNNTNEMAEETFSKFVEQIQEKGFDVPIIVVDNPDDETDTDYMIIDGEHRWEAANSLGFKTIPSIIKQSLTEKDYLTEPTKRNELTGNLNPHKTEDLINTLQDDWNIDDQEILKNELGMIDDQEIEQYIESEVEDEEDVEEQLEQEVEDEDSENEVSMVDNISELLNDLMSRFGDTIPQSFFSFVHPQGGTHMLIGMDDVLKDIVKSLSLKLKEEDIDANEYFKDLLESEASEYPSVNDSEFEEQFSSNRYEDVGE